MKVKNYKKTKREQVFEILDSTGGNITDTQTAKIFGEEKLYCISEHKRIWKRLNSDRNFFSDKEIVNKHKAHRKHLVQVKDTDYWYAVCKEYFNEIDNLSTE